MYRIGVITTSRADFGIYRPVLEALAATGRMEVGLIATGLHLRPDLGDTIKEVEQSGFPLWARPEIALASDTAAGVTKTMGLCHLSLADFFAVAPRIDLLLALGDRSEMMAAVAAAQPFLIPVAHLHGGDETEGAFDNAFRHAITKLSHLHLVATPLARRRVLAMGERPERVHLTGAPSLDRVAASDRIERGELERRFGLPRDPFVLVTFHAETLSDHSGEAAVAAGNQFRQLVEALFEFGAAVVFTAANSDPGGLAINRDIRALTASAERPVEAVFVENFGAAAYFSALRHALVMVGNTSSGILEAASFGVPVVNLGDRQRGRERSENTIDAPVEKTAILQAMRLATSREFRARAQQGGNVYGDGRASPRIAAAILEFLDSGAPVRKTFNLAD